MNIIDIEEISAKIGKRFTLNILGELCKLKEIKYELISVKEDKLKSKTTSLARYYGWSKRELTIIKCPIKVTEELISLFDSNDIGSNFYVYIPIKLDNLVLGMNRLERLKAFI